MVSFVDSRSRQKEEHFTALMIFVFLSPRSRSPFLFFPSFFALSLSLIERREKERIKYMEK